jgi:hypothetical protein
VVPDFIPRADNDFLTWSVPFVQQVAADPGRYFVSADDAAALVEAQAAFAQALALAQGPGTRTTVAVAGKGAARAALERRVRATAGVARAALETDRATMLDLGLAVGRGRQASRPRIGPPASGPAVWVRQVDGSRVSVLLHNSDAPSRRGLARNIAGAYLFSFVGDAPPAVGGWRLHQTTSRTDATLDFGSSYPPGTQVWVAAQWMNRRCESGPTGTAVSSYLGYPTMTSNLG